MINAVIFDFGNVICKFDMRIFVEKVSRMTNTPFSKMQDILHQSFPLARDYETGLISSDEFFSRISGMYGLSLPRKTFVHAFVDVFTPIPSTFHLIRELKPRYKLGLLSNTNEWHFEYGIKPVEVFPLFDSITLSFEVKAMKPAEKIYRDALDKLKLNAAKCVYIDDIKENSDAATRIGIHGIHFTTHGELVKTLQILGVQVHAE
jgi:epoxide hydrolase-like predicted phosphatase